MVVVVVVFPSTISISLFVFINFNFAGGEGKFIILKMRLARNGIAVHPPPPPPSHYLIASIFHASTKRARKINESRLGVRERESNPPSPFAHFYAQKSSSFAAAAAVNNLFQSELSALLSLSHYVWNEQKMHITVRFDKHHSFFSSWISFYIHFHSVKSEASFV